VNSEACRASLAHCRRLARRAGSSFPLAFRVLPPAKRDAMTALYAFLRVTDDLADEPGDPAAKRAALSHWRAGLDAALSRGVYSHPVHAALHHAVETFAIPPRHLYDVMDGVADDLEPVAFENFAALYPYCYRVASAVGLACVPVWGLRDGVTSAEAHEPAEATGIAFQLTNILRDLGEDLARGRVYLPRDELQRFGCPPESWRDPAARPAFRELMRFQTARARDYYDRGRPLEALLTPEGRAVFGLMAGLYRRLLGEIERRDFDVFTRRVRLSRLTKLRHLLAAWPVKWSLR
jgi:phytoene synthase